MQNGFQFAPGTFHSVFMMTVIPASAFVGTASGQPAQNVSSLKA
ncbi:MAG: hypothetical protein OJF48_001011 [Afipia sp.]|nr:MAG: hypothetical protein OJF48_001011 [Afipia sp.]